MSLGKPVGAFPGQDHLAHMQVLLDYLKDPMYGSNPIIAPTFIPAALEHLKQHLTLYYLDKMDGYTSEALGRNFNILKEQTVMKEAQQLLATSSQMFAQDSQQMLGGVAQVMQGAMQMMQQLRSQQQPQDPSVQALVQTQMAETQRKAQYDQARVQLDQAKLQAQIVDSREDNESAQAIKAAEITHNVDVLNLQQRHEIEKQQLAQQQEMQMAQQQAAQQAAMQQQPPQPGQPQPAIPPQGA